MKTHYSRKPIKALRSVEQNPNADIFKPAGLWYGVDGAWEEWCSSEMPDWIKGGLLYEIRLGNERLLRITTISDLDAFSSYNMRGRNRFDGINWTEIATEYDGIEISPYQWKRRLSLTWYYTWDCASGCIWRPRGAALKLIRDDRQS